VLEWGYGHLQTESSPDFFGTYGRDFREQFYSEFSETEQYVLSDNPSLRRISRRGFHRQRDGFLEHLGERAHLRDSEHLARRNAVLPRTLRFIPLHRGERLNFGFNAHNLRSNNRSELTG
jgi:hypothetical protein